MSYLQTGGKRLDFEKFAVRTNIVVALLGAIFIVLGAAVVGRNLYAGITGLMIGPIQIVIALTSIARIRSRERLIEKGNVNVMHSWWILSVGIAVLVIFTSPLARIGIGSWIGGTIGALWMILGSLSVYLSMKFTGATPVP